MCWSDDVGIASSASSADGVSGVVCVISVVCEVGTASERLLEVSEFDGTGDGGESKKSTGEVAKIGVTLGLCMCGASPSSTWRV